MNVFVLNTGRCGSTTFIRACSHISNYTAGHETRTRLLYPEHLDYPDNHIEADNRLVWFLGLLEEKYGNEAFYVYLTRNSDDVVRSYARRRFAGGILKAYYESIKMGANIKKFTELHDEEYELYARDYVVTAQKNIEYFLQNKRDKITVRLENIENDYRIFWEAIGAEGNIDLAMEELRIVHNKGKDINDGYSYDKRKNKYLEKIKNIF